MIFKKFLAALGEKESQYAKIATRYSQSTRSSFDAENYRRMLHDWVPLVSKNITILDVGCGEGTFTNFLKEEFTESAGQVIGIDESQEMITLAKESYPDITFLRNRMQGIELPDNSIDFAFSRFAVHYSEDLLVTLTEIARVTKPGGLFFLQDIHPFHVTFLKPSKNYEKKEDVTFRAQCDDDIKLIHPSFTFEEYLNGFSKAGWDIVSFHEIYGRYASGEGIAPYRAPTSMGVVLKKRS
jgi:ubiquinone/menaquinone biosynthesis C-methylase UbiE